MSDPTLSLPFDQYQRYRLVTDILNDVRGADQKLSVLDVGGRTALLRQFLPQDSVFIVDVEESEEEGLVLGDGSRLPFKDASVDAVVTFDTLEHVPPAGRAAFLAECRRVARRWVVVAGPYDTPGVAHSELLLTQFLKDKLKVEHRYLAEHAAHGLPQLAATEEALGAGGAVVTSIGHANLHRWLALMCAELYMDHDAPLRDLAKKYYEFYNGSHYTSDHASPVYRHAVVAAIDGAPMPIASDLLGPPQAPLGSYEPVAHVLQELIEFDVQRDVVKGEWSRLETVNAGLVKDLKGHKDTLDENCEEIHRLKLVQDEMGVRIEDLKQGNEMLETRAEDLEQSVSYQQKRADQERTRADDLEQVVEFHDGRAKDLEQRATELSGEVDKRDERLVEQGEHIGKLETRTVELEENVSFHQNRTLEVEEIARSNQARAQEQMTALEQRLHEANLTIGTKQASIDSVRPLLTAERQKVDQLNSQLLDRWANLLRALGIK